LRNGSFLLRTRFVVIGINVVSTTPITTGFLSSLFVFGILFNIGTRLPLIPGNTIGGKITFGAKSLLFAFP